MIGAVRQQEGSPAGDSVDDKLIANYIRHRTFPVQWVIWWLEAPSSATRVALREVLFEPGSDSLRSLTEPTVVEAVVRVVLGNELLRVAVAREVDQHLEAVAEKAMRVAKESDG